MIEFSAEQVEAIEEKYTSEFTVVGIYFGEGDPEKDGQHWNFTQSIGDDEDEGICVVKEVQQIVFYDNIEEFIISKNQLKCVFDDSIINTTGTKSLIINYNISDQKWSKILYLAKKVFKGEKYFKIT